MKTHLFTATPLLLALCLAPAAAQAQAQTQITDADRTAARALGKEGHEASDSKDWATAADRFARADAIIHAPTFLLGLAQAQVGLGKLVAAQATYGRILSETWPKDAPPAFVKAVETAKTESAALDARLPYVVVRVTGGAAVEVTVDGEVVSGAALGAKRAVDPGAHLIRAAGVGFEDLEVRVVSVEGKTETLTLEPKPVAGAPVPPGPAPVKAPTAEKPKASPPLAEKAPPVTAAQAPAAPGSTRKTLGIVGLVAGGAGLGLGAAMGGLALSKRGEIAPLCPNGTCPSGQYAALRPALDDYHLFGAVSTASLIAGGVLAGTGAVLLLTAPGSAKSTTTGHVAPWLTVTPLFGPGYAGAKGSFR